MDEEILERPWSAQIATPVDGHKPKYNLPLYAPADGKDQLSSALTQTQNAIMSKSPSHKALKEKWAKHDAPKGVDYERPSAAANDAPVPKREGSCELVQGYLKSQHPLWGEKPL